MKTAKLVVPLFVASHAAGEKVGDKTITKVVKLLQGMLEKSKEDGAEERKRYAKFKCYCDSNEEEKRESIKDLGTQIAILEAKIEETRGSSGSLSTQVAKLRAGLTDNEQAQGEAKSVRSKANEEFVAAETDMKTAIAAMTQALETLAEVGADQTLSDAEDHKKFMAGYKASFLSVKTEVRDVLSSASAFLPPQQRNSVQSFIQAPFTGSYTSQSGQVVGILKSMRDTFESNLAAARATEKAEVKAFTELMKTLEEENDKMQSSYDKKQEELGSNDEAVSDLKGQWEEAKSQKADDEEFLSKLLGLCETKANEYAERKSLRANEEAAIAEAIAILNSDEAFETFGKVDATSTGATGASFLQIQRHVDSSFLQESVGVRNQARALLQTVAGAKQSMRLAKVAALLVAGNPFATVLKEIEKMILLIADEGKADKENLDWCNDERTDNDKNLADKNSQISTLEEEITKLNKLIDDPESGLKVQISQTEESLRKNVESQKTQTKARKEENRAYQEDIGTLVKAEEILAKAVKVLKKYYEALEKRIAAAEGASLLQQEPPETFGTYEGQSGKGGDAIEMIEFILAETKKEEVEAHKDEEAAQKAYEDSMSDLKAGEEENQKNIVNLKKELASKEKDLVQKQDELKETTADKEAIEAYLLKIKPGCDFITTNFETREDNRETETKALESAASLLKETPAYKAAVAEAHTDSFGDCKEVCVKDEEHVNCKACMAEVTVPGYCAGHSDTKGC